MNTQADAVPYRYAHWLAAAALLALPAIAMQFTDEVNWGPLDFGVFGAMLLALCTGWEFVRRRVRTRGRRWILGLGMLGAFLLLWAHLAVDLFDGGATERPATVSSPAPGSATGG